MLAGAALSIYRKQFAALVLTSALALLPANLVVGGAWVLGLAAITAQDAPSGPGEARPRAPDRLDAPKAPDAHPEVLPGESLPLRLAKAGPLLLALLAGAAALLFATLLSLAALVPLVLGAAARPAQAWAAVAARWGTLLPTCALSVTLTLAGACLGGAPGVLLATGFAFAVPVAMVEGLRGRKALERSWVLMRAEWPSVLVVVVLSLAAVAAATLGAQALAGPGLRQLAGAAALRMLLLPLAQVALVLLYERARAAVDAQPLPAARAQYIRRISAPG